MDSVGRLRPPTNAALGRRLATQAPASNLSEDDWYKDETHCDSSGGPKFVEYPVDLGVFLRSDLSHLRPPPPTEPTDLHIRICRVWPFVKDESQVETEVVHDVP